MKTSWMLNLIKSTIYYLLYWVVYGAIYIISGGSHIQAYSIANYMLDRIKIRGKDNSNMKNKNTNPIKVIHFESDFRQIYIKVKTDNINKSYQRGFVKYIGLLGDHALPEGAPCYRYDVYCDYITLRTQLHPLGGILTIESKEKIENILYHMSKSTMFNITHDTEIINETIMELCADIPTKNDTIYQPYLIKDFCEYTLSDSIDIIDTFNIDRNKPSNIITQDIVEAIREEYFNTDNVEIHVSGSQETYEMVKKYMNDNLSIPKAKSTSEPRSQHYDNYKPEYNKSKEYIINNIIPAHEDITKHTAYIYTNDDGDNYISYIHTNGLNLINFPKISHPMKSKFILSASYKVYIDNNIDWILFYIIGECIKSYTNNYEFMQYDITESNIPNIYIFSIIFPGIVKLSLKKLLSNHIYNKKRFNNILKTIYDAENGICKESIVLDNILRFNRQYKSLNDLLNAISKHCTYENWLKKIESLVDTTPYYIEAERAKE